MNNHLSYYSVSMPVAQCLCLSRERISYPLVKAFIFGTRGNNRLFMDRRRYSHVKTSRVRLFRLNPFFSAHIQKYFKGYIALFSQTSNIISIKISTTIKPYELASKHFNIGVVSNKGSIAIKSHQVVHGFTSLSFNQLRMLATAPLSVVGLGCGRWNTRTSSNKKTAIREPSLSLISPPSATNKASISDHLILALTGRANISDRVLACFRFIKDMVLNYDTTNKHNTAPVSLKNLLTFPAISRSIKSLTKTSSGRPHPKDFAVFLRLLQAQTRHFYDGLSVHNTTPFEGISTAVYWQLVITRRLYLNEAAFTKLKPVGGLIMPKKIQPIAVFYGKPTLFIRLKLWIKGVRYV